MFELADVRLQSTALTHFNDFQGCQRLNSIYNFAGGTFIKLPESA
jgi:hypothetical protein